jgi:hypothetical protein
MIAFLADDSHIPVWVLNTLAHSLAKLPASEADETKGSSRAPREADSHTTPHMVRSSELQTNPQGPDLRGPKIKGDAGVAHHIVESVERSRNRNELAVHPGSP